MTDSSSRPVSSNPSIRRRSGIVTQTVLLASAIAAIAVLVAGASAAPFVRTAAETEARGSLATLADLATTFVERGELRRDRLLPRPLQQVLKQEQVTGYIVSAELARPPEFSEADLAALLAGDSVSATGQTQTGEPMLIEGRPVTGGKGVVLFQPLTVAGEATGVFLIRIVSALALGLLIAVVIAYFAAKRLSRPLQAARVVAHDMADGQRDRTLTPSGPAEVADIAEALNALNAALVASEGRQRDFLLSVSHELRTPLTAIKGYGEALGDEVLPTGDTAAVGETIASEATRLNRLVNDLLDLARMGAVDFRVATADIDLSEVVIEASRVWTDRCAREGVNFVSSGVQSSVLVRADAMRVRQILDNLLENALRISPRDSCITVSVHTDLELTGGPFAVVEVRDSGPGLTTEDLNVAFQPGALHERYRGIRPVGTGLGLALVSRLATAMGGSATVTSSPHEGTSFWVRLPLAAT